MVPLSDSVSRRFASVAVMTLLALPALAGCGASPVCSGAGCSGTTSPCSGSGCSTGNPSLVGDWIGPDPASNGSCGSAYSEYDFQANGDYAVVTDTDDCGGFTLEGVYDLSGDTLTFDQERSSVPDAAQSLTYSVTCSFPTSNSVTFVSGAESYTYTRDSG